MKDSLYIDNLSRAEFLDLRKQLGDAVKEEVNDKPEKTYGVLDLLTVSLILGSQALFICAAWLLKNKENETVKFSSKEIDKEGNEKIVEFKMTIKKETTSKEVVEEIGKAFNLPKELLKDI